MTGKTKWIVLILAALLTLSMAATLTACGDGDDDDDDDDGGATGSLEFYANGEEFIRDGFVGLTGWQIDFDHFYVTLAGITGYQVAVEDAGLDAAHAGHPHNDIPEGSEHVVLDGSHFVDLAEGTERSLIGTAANAPIGNYNYLNFNMLQADEGDWAGYSIILAGTATGTATSAQEGDTIDFTIMLEDQMTFSGCHQEVDDENAGVVAEGGTGSMELTFHSDHIFGDEESIGEEGSVNEIALGFQPLADLAEGGSLVITQTDLASALSGDDYLTFVDALRTIGHSGEGHCEYSEYVEE